MRFIKRAKAAYISTCAAIAVIGLILILFPEISMLAVCYMLGIAAIVFGIVKITGYFSADPYGLAFQFDFAFGIIAILLGLVVIIHPGNIMALVPVIMGIYFMIDGIMKIRGIRKIDVIVGGPPCQAYSLVGRAQSSHMETPMEDDPRNYLYKLYARFLKKYQPRMFVFENVTGIESAQGGAIWKNLQKYLKRVGYKIECREQNAHTFGVLQNRRRMIIVGWLKNSGLAYPDFIEKEANAVVNDLFTDLPELHPGESNNTYSKKKPSRYVIETGIRTKDDVLTLQNCRPNIERDIRIYERAIELWNDGHRRLNYNDLPEELKTHKNRHSFTDRFKVVEGDEQCCHTILAHLSKDGHYFIHPDISQHRSITVREAARIQSFPDSYYFEGPRTSQFVQIGNAVPPLMARGIAEGIFAQLHGEDADGQQ